MRKRPWAGDATLIAVTGLGQKEDHAKSAEAGFDRHLVKPVDLPDLYELIAELRAAARGRGAAALAEG
jgi:CheY-like chemotaxis protein